MSTKKEASAEIVTLDSRLDVWMIQPIKGNNKQAFMEKLVKLDYRPLENEAIRLDGAVRTFEEIIHNADNGRMEVLLKFIAVSNLEKGIKEFEAKEWRNQADSDDSQEQEQDKA